MKKSDNYVYVPEVAACGLYCGACYKFLQEKCPGCTGNEKAGWCKIRQCCREHGWRSCADCTLVPLGECGKFNHFVGKVFGLLFNSNRSACIARIREVGYEQYSKEMYEQRKMTIPRR